MHGIDAVKEHLSDSDRRLLRNVMAYESNWLLDYYYRSRPEEKGRVQAGTVENNDPEGNIWCGAHILRTAMMYPDEPRVNEYREKGIRFLVNGISLSSDAHSQEIVSGKPVSEWHIGANFFDSFALNHHRYLNIGYIVICLSNLAMLYFSYRLKGLPVPEFIYRHVESLWNLVKLCTFPDGRLCRIGGDTRIRYCYCQDYVIPVWLMISDLCGDKDCGKFEQGWLDIIRKEMDINGDGSFLSARCNWLAAVSPLYYTRLESDRAATLSMGAYWRRVLKISSASKKGNAGILKQFWYDEYHGACLQRGKNRISSFCWKAAQPPQGLCLPADRSDLAEWKCNCAGTVIGLGIVNYQKLINHKEYLFEGGFITAGQTEICSEDFIGEGQKPETVGKHTVIFASLPDDATVLLMQRCVSPGNRVYLKEIKGLLYNVPNDIFNDNVRSYYSEKGFYKSEGCSGK